MTDLQKIYRYLEIGGRFYWGESYKGKRNIFFDCYEISCEKCPVYWKEKPEKSDCYALPKMFYRIIKKNPGFAYCVGMYESIESLLANWP